MRVTVLITQFLGAAAPFGLFRTLAQSGFEDAQFVYLLLRDQSPTLTERLIALLPGLIVRGGEDTSLSILRNRAITEFPASLYLFVDSNMSTSSSLLSEHLELQRRQVGGILMGNVRLRDQANPSPFSNYLARPGVVYDAPLISDPKAVAGDAFFSGHLSMRAEVFQEVGPFDEHFSGQAADVDYGRRIRLTQRPIVFAPGLEAEAQVPIGLDFWLDRWTSEAEKAHGLMRKYPDRSFLWGMVKYLRQVHRNDQAFGRLKALAEQLTSNHASIIHCSDEQILTFNRLFETLRHACLSRAFVSHMSPDAKAQIFHDVVPVFGERSQQAALHV